MARKDKGVQVSATVSPALNTWLDDHRWNVRKTKAEVVKAAVEEYAARHGYLEVDPEGILPETESAHG